jgi:hypothetical protein
MPLAHIGERLVRCGSATGCLSSGALWRRTGRPLPSPTIVRSVVRLMW